MKQNISAAIRHGVYFCCLPLVRDIQYLYLMFLQEHEINFQIKDYTNLQSLLKLCVLSTDPLQLSQRSTSTALKRKSHYSVETNLNAT